MLWSLFKILFFVALIAALTLGAGALLETDGGVQITAGGTEVTLGPLEAVIGVLALIVVLWVALKVASFLVALLRFVNGDETAITRYFDRNRERRGYQALGEGLLALASGEGRLAMSKAARAERYLQRPELTDLVTAQAAEMAGDKTRADEVYRRLISHQDTRFVGVRGVLRQRLAEGDTETALKLAERAFALKPKHEETQDILMKLQTEQGDWTGARATLNAKLKSGTLPRDVHRRREAVLAMSQATALLGDDSSIESREAGIGANRLSPDLIPAAVMAARGYIEDGKKRYATRVIKKAWDVQPHPTLAAVFAEIEPDEDVTRRLKRFQALTRLHPDHRETKLLLAELNIAAEDFPAARRAMGDLAETEPDARSLTVMAAIERGEGASDTVIQGWLARAVTASRGPQWVCDNCNSVHSEWAPLCSNCQSFDTLTWTTPQTDAADAVPGLDMLPLIIGPAKDEADDAIGTEVAEAEVIDLTEAAKADASPEADSSDKDAAAETDKETAQRAS